MRQPLPTYFRGVGEGKKAFLDMIGVCNLNSNPLEGTQRLLEVFQA